MQGPGFIPGRGCRVGGRKENKSSFIAWLLLRTVREVGMEKVGQPGCCGIALLLIALAFSINKARSTQGSLVSSSSLNHQLTAQGLGHS